MRTLHIVGICFFLATPALAEPFQDQAQFTKALANHTTSPSFVLITVIDDRTGQSRSGCVDANAVRGAIYQEKTGTYYDPALSENVEAMLLASKDHVFHFSRKKALDNVQFRYTGTDLEHARAVLLPLSTEQLLARPSPWNTDKTLDWNAATACVLIEHGLSSQRADRSGEIIAAP